MRVLKMQLLGWFAVLFFVAFPYCAWAGAVITYHGRILDPQKHPVEASNVVFRIRVYSPNPKKCLLYEEVRTLNMTGSQGIFVIPIGDGHAFRTAADPGILMEKVFSNDPNTTFDSIANPKIVCNSGTFYTPAFLDQRHLEVSFDDQSGVGEQTLPLMDINFVPFAVNAHDTQNVGGVPASSVLRVSSGVATPLSTSNYTELVSLLNGTSTQYEKAGISNQVGQPNGLATLDANSLVPTSQLGSGVADSSKVLRGDGTWGVVPGASQWTTVGSDISYSTGKVGIGSSSPTNLLTLESTGSDYTKHYILNKVSSTSTNWQGTPGISLVKNHSVDSNPGETINNEELGEYAISGTSPDGLNYNAASIKAIQVGSAIAGKSVGAQMRFMTADGLGGALSPRMTISNTGNIGVGTNSPVAKLHIGVGPSVTSNYPVFALGTGPFDGVTAGFFAGSSNGTFVGVNASSGYLGNFVDFQVNGVSKFSIDNLGNISSSGNSSSSGNYSTSGNISTTGTGTITSAGVLTAASGAASFSPTSGSLVVVGGAGISGAVNVGSTLEANGSISSSSGTAATSGLNQSSPSIYLKANYWNGSASVVDKWGVQNILGSGINPSSTLTFSHTGSSGTSQYAFLDGNVGIGTNTPTTALHVQSAGEATVLMRSTASNSYAGFLIRDYNNANAASVQYGNPSAGAFINEFVLASRQAGIPMVFYQGGTSAANRRITLDASGNTIFNSGNIGIGTVAPVEMLSIQNSNANATMRLSSGPSASYNSDFFMGTDSRDWRIRASNGAGLYGLNFSYVGADTPVSNILHLSKIGNVGIGTTTPRSSLDVAGTISQGNFFQGFYAFDAATNWQSSSNKQYLKIMTKIPYADGPYIDLYIKGINYNSRQIVDIHLSWYMWAGGFWYPVAVSNGEHTPSISLASESGYVVIMLDCGASNRWYFSQLRFDAFAKDYTNSNIFSGWTASEADLSSSSNITSVTVNAKNRIFNGNVGVGTSNPLTKLDVAGTLHVGSDPNDNNYQVLSLHNSHISTSSRYFTGIVNDIAGGYFTYISPGAMSFRFSNNASYPLRFLSQSWNGASYDLTERLRIDGSNGNVGIGSNSPSYKLHVVGANGTTVGYFSDGTQSCSITPSLAGNISCSSDERLKQDVRPYGELPALDSILKLQAVTDKWRSVDNGRHTGYLAQEVEKVVPEFVQTGSDGYKQVSYTGLIPLITESIKVLYKNVVGVKTEVRDLQIQVQDLQRENLELKARMERIEKTLLKEQQGENR